MKISVNFLDVCSKPTIRILFKFDVVLFVLYFNSCFVVFTCLYFDLLVKAASHTFPNSTMKAQEKVWNLFKANNENTGGMSMFHNVSMWMTSFWWIQLYLNLFQHLFFHSLFHYFIWYTVRYTMRQTLVLANDTRSTILWGGQHCPELAFRNTDFSVPENLIFPALYSETKKDTKRIVSMDMDQL